MFPKARGSIDPMNAVIASMESGLAQLDAARRLAVEYAVDVRRRFGDRVHSVRLYGSARGDWSPESDIDVLVLLDRASPEDSEWLVSHAVALGVLGSGLLLQPMFMTVDDFAYLQKRERRFAVEVLSARHPNLEQPRFPTGGKVGSLAEGCDLFLWAGRRYCELTVSELAFTVGTEYAAVSVAIRRLEHHAARSRTLRDMQTRLSTILNVAR
jgi:predicted nucleotidyltransferase